MALSVEERIKHLRKEASDRSIYGKAKAVARHLGSVQPKKHGAYHVYRENKLIISWDDYAPNLSIAWNDQNVFRVHLGTVMSYRPDVEDWLERLETVYENDVAPDLETQRRNREHREARELYDKWGIKEDY